MKSKINTVELLVKSGVSTESLSKDLGVAENELKSYIANISSVKTQRGRGYILIINFDDGSSRSINLKKIVPSFKNCPNLKKISSNRTLFHKFEFCEDRVYWNSPEFSISISQIYQLGKIITDPKVEFFLEARKKAITQNNKSA